MIKYTVRAGDICEEFQFEHVDELLKYLDWRKYNVKMDKDFYPDDDELDMTPEQVVQNDWSEFGHDHKTDHWNHHVTVGNVSFDDSNKTDKDVLKDAFDKIGVRYEDHGDFLSLENQEQLIDTLRIDINFDDLHNYEFKNLEVF